MIKAKNLIYTLSSNLLSFVVSALITFIVPKFLSVESYGYFQLYLFFTTYIGFFHFGWIDGIYLRYGGAYYDKLDKHRFSGQFWLFCIFELCVCSIMCFLGMIMVTDHNRFIVVLSTGLATLFYLPKTFLQYVLQCVNRFKQYSMLIYVEKCIYAFAVFCALLFRSNGFLIIIIADLAAKIFSLLYGTYICRDLIFVKPEKIKNVFNETWNNISIGIKLTISNISSLLIVGIIRFAIDTEWDISTFGKVSLALSVSNMLMVFIKAVSLVLFPALKRMDRSVYAKLYKQLRYVLMLPLLGLLIMYYPIRYVLSIWIPAYADSIRFMALLFPICVFESKMSMLVQTFLNSLRKESLMMKINLLCVLFSMVGAAVVVVAMRNLVLSVILITCLLACRCIMCECIISSILNIDIWKNILSEVILSIIFMITGFICNPVAGLLLYIAAYLVYLFIFRKDTLNFYKHFFKKGI